MATLKSNLKNISKETESLIKEYINLLAIKQTEKLALLLGLISSIFVLSTLALSIIAFLSFALATYLNSILASVYLGYLIVSGIYTLIFLIILLKVVLSKKPILVNVFTKFVISIFSIHISYSKNYDGLQREIENIEHKIETNKIKIKADAKVIKYLVLESFIKELFGLFKSKSKKGENASDENTTDTIDPISEDKVAE